MAGKIYIPSSENPLNPPPSGSWILFIDSSGQYKKMASDGTITNLTAQAVQDMSDVEITSLQDGQFLKYDASIGKWVNTDSSVDIDPDDLDDTNTAHKFVSAQEKAQITINESNITTLTSDLDSAEVTIANNTSAISGKEDDLGNPSVSGYVLSSTTTGTRNWVPMTGGSGGGGGDVASVFGRTGTVLAENGDYNTDQVTEGTTNKYITASKLAQIDTNAGSISTNAGDIATNATDIGINETAIQTNASAIATKEPSITAGTSAQYYRGDKTFQALDKDAVGLSDVDNTSDLDKPISTATSTALSGKEDALGNPVQSGYILSSTDSGTRSWVPAPSGGGGGAVDSWNGRTGIVSPENNDYNADQISTDGTTNQFISDTDLAQIATNTSNISVNESDIEDNQIAISDNATNIAGKEEDLGTPSVDGYVLSSTTAGVRSWIDLPTAPTAPVDSVFGRTGAVVAQAGDYDADQIDDSATTHKFATESQLIQIGTNTSDITSLESTMDTVEDALVQIGSALPNKENSLGAPSENGDVLSSDTNGNRAWISLPDIPVDSVFGRTGSVTAQANDYNADQIDDSATTNKFATASQLLQIGLNTAELALKEPAITAGNTGQYYRGDKTFQDLNSAAVGLSQVDNTSDADKPVSTATQTALDAKVNNSEKGVADGIATLNSLGQVPAIQLPSFVSNVQEYDDFASFPAAGQPDTIYVAIDTGVIYRWSGTAYVEISASTAVWGEVSGILSNQTDLQTALDAKLDDTEKGAANGIATLDSTSKVPLSQIPDGIAGGLAPTLIDLTAGIGYMDDGKAYLVKPSESNAPNNELYLPIGQDGMNIAVYDINYKFAQYNVKICTQASQTIDGFDKINMDVEHAWIQLFFIDGEWKTADTFAH